jgi:hypothetical protein
VAPIRNGIERIIDLNNTTTLQKKHAAANIKRIGRPGPHALNGAIRHVWASSADTGVERDSADVMLIHTTPSRRRSIFFMSACCLMQKRVISSALRRVWRRALKKR